MPEIYEVEICYEPLEKVSNDLVPSFFAIKKIENELNVGKNVVLKLTVQTGAPLNDLKSALEWFFEDKAKIKFHWVKLKLLVLKKEKSYLEYLAECYATGKVPLSKEEFRKEYFEGENGKH